MCGHACVNSLPPLSYFPVDDDNSGEIEFPEFVKVSHTHKEDTASY